MPGRYIAKFLAIIQQLDRIAVMGIVSFALGLQLIIKANFLGHILAARYHGYSGNI
jgi:hypothetical protein